MDIFDEEILKFWAALQNQGVRYIMVGGYATNLHGFQRYTGGLDIWIDDTLENRKQLRKAFVESGMEDYYMNGTSDIFTSLSHEVIPLGLLYFAVTCSVSKAILPLFCIPPHSPHQII